MQAGNVAAENKTIQNDFSTSMQADFEEMAESVSKNKGFYVGRYETSNMTTGAGTTVKVISGKTSGINNIHWYYMYAQQKGFADNNSLSASIGNSMIWGSQWDAMLKFIGQSADADHVTSTSYANHNLSNVYNTGDTDNQAGYNDKACNIYDLEGNVYELTTEAYSTGGRVCRGRGLRLQQFSILPQQRLFEHPLSGLSVLA